MTVKRLDVSYEYYFNIYNCGHQCDLSTQDFERYICRAERELEGYFDLGKVTDNNQEAVWLCACEIAEVLSKFEPLDSVKSETVDGYAVTYSDRGSRVRKIRRIVLRRLGNTDLLFAGV